MISKGFTIVVGFQINHSKLLYGLENDTQINVYCCNIAVICMKQRTGVCSVTEVTDDPFANGIRRP